MTRRVLVTIVVIVTGLLLQSTLFWQFKLLGVRPELMFLVTIVVAILEGPQEGAITGFAAGLAQDFLLNQPKGVTALTLTLVGYSAGLARQYIVSASPLLPTILVAVGTAAGVAFYQVVAFLLDQLQETFAYAARVTLLSALYGALLTPIVYPLLRRVIEGSRPTRVVRFEMERSSARLKVFAILVLVMFGALSTRLWFLQVLATEAYVEQAEDNGVRTVAIDALRGEIWTSDQYGKPNGVPLVKNRSSLEVRVDVQELEESGMAEQVLSRLSKMLDLSVRKIRAELESTKYFEYQPKPIAEFVPEEVAFAIGERQEEFPGVQVRNTNVREYPMERTASHMVGWVGQVQALQLDQAREGEYGPNDVAGQAGLEARYEKWLRGRKGLVRYVVNSDGERIRELGGREPTSGGDLVLTLDSRWQQAAEQYLQDSIYRTRQVFDDSPEHMTNFKADAGVVVVLDVETGGVKAMASWPDFDPRWYVTGLTNDQQCYLGYDPKCTGADDAAPLLNRAYQEVYLPGSTFKPFTALAAVKEGYASLDTSYDCPASYVHPGDESGTDFLNWSTFGLGYMSIGEGLWRSCDTMFYSWGSDFWFRYQNDQLGEDNEPLQKDLRAWGFEEPTGIDLPGEASGFLPDAAWGNDWDQRDLFPKGWNPGGYILTMIGSGYMSVTPLQLAAAYGAIANDGHLCRPHVVDRIMASDRETVLKQVNGRCDRTVPYTRQQLDYVREALTQVPVSGTARTPFLGFPLSEIPVAGKTGTAFRGTQFQDTSWFAAMVPANDPKYVVVAMVEQAGFGSDVAAPLVRRMIEEMYGIEPGGQVISSTGQD